MLSVSFIVGREHWMQIVFFIHSSLVPFLFLSLLSLTNDAYSFGF